MLPMLPPAKTCAPLLAIERRYLTELLRILVAAAERGEPCPLTIHSPPPAKPN